MTCIDETSFEITHATKACYFRDSRPTLVTPSCMERPKLSSSARFVNIITHIRFITRQSKSEAELFTAFFSQNQGKC